MTIAYIAHPISGDRTNLTRILKIAQQINREEPQVVPFVPYYLDVLCLDDTIPEERTRGIRNGTEVLRRTQVDVVRLYGDRITNGMWAEIRLARELGIPVEARTKETTRQLHTELNFLG